MNPWKSPNASLAHTYNPPSSGKREDNSLMTNAPGTKKKSAASTHRLIEEVPLCPAAAIHLGPSTEAMLNSSTSQKPIDLRRCGSELSAGGGLVMDSPGKQQGTRLAWANHIR